MKDGDFYRKEGEVSLIIGTDRAYDLHPIEDIRDDKSQIAFCKSQISQKLLAIGAINALRHTKVAIPLNNMDDYEHDPELEILNNMISLPAEPIGEERMWQG